MRTERPQVKQDRAVRTRRAILEAAAVVFEERGYESAKLSDIVNIAKVTKGALYFHFDSKEHLAQAVIDAQVASAPRAMPQAFKVQEFVDTGMIFSHRLRHDVLMRASARLTLDQTGLSLDRASPYEAWIDLHLTLMTEAKERGELLTTVDPIVPARLIVGSYAGLNMMSHMLGMDMEEQVSALYTHVMPNLVVPSLAIRLDTAPGRGARALYGPQGTHPCDYGCVSGVPRSAAGVDAEPWTAEAGVQGESRAAGARP